MTACVKDAGSILILTYPLSYTEIHLCPVADINYLARREH